MSARWEDILRLPGAAYAGGRRVPKTALTSRAMLTKHEQRTLDKMSRLEHFATVAKGTAQVLPRVNEEYDIQSVIFLRCEMKGDSQAVAEVARLLHGCFPNPTVILQEAGDGIAVSAALTRRSHAERGATVVCDVESTGLFEPDDERYAPFLDSLAFDRLPQDDLLSYAKAISSCVRLSQAIDALGFYPTCAPGDRDRLLSLVADYERQQAEVDTLAKQRSARDVSPNESARIRMRVRTVKKRLNATVEEIRGICHE
jgi:hypothetical protein